jgi:hypothetical protein
MGMNNHNLPTLAKKVFTTQYKQRPKISFLIKMAVSRFPNTRAPGWAKAYRHRPDAARPTPTMLIEKQKVKSLRYVLYHTNHRIQREGFFDTGFESATALSPGGVGFWMAATFSDEEKAGGWSVGVFFSVGGG